VYTFCNLKFSMDIVDGYWKYNKKTVLRIGTWPTKWSLMTPLKGWFQLPLKILTDNLAGFDQGNMLNKVQKMYSFFFYLKISTKKTFFRGQFVSLYFQHAIINVVKEV